MNSFVHDCSIIHNSIGYLTIVAGVIENVVATNKIRLIAKSTIPVSFDVAIDLIQINYQHIPLFSLNRHYLNLSDCQIPQYVCYYSLGRSWSLSGL